MKNSNIVRLFGFMLTISLLLAACQESTPTVPPALDGPGIGVGFSRNSCPNVEVKAGDQVVWINQDSREQIIQEQPPAGQDVRFDSGMLQPGDSFSFTFIEPGSYTYRCSQDGEITGTVTVLP